MQANQHQRLTQCIHRLQNRLGGGEGIEGLYGSLTRTGMQRILDSLTLHCGLGSDSRLVDIGAGLCRYFKPTAAFKCSQPSLAALTMPRIQSQEQAGPCLTHQAVAVFRDLCCSPSCPPCALGLWLSVLMMMGLLPQAHAVMHHHLALTEVAACCRALSHALLAAACLLQASEAGRRIPHGSTVLAVHLATSFCLLLQAPDARPGDAWRCLHPGHRDRLGQVRQGASVCQADGCGAEAAPGGQQAAGAAVGAVLPS